LSNINLPRETALVVLELKYRPNPKSPSFTIPCAVIKTLAGFISANYKKIVIIEQYVVSFSNMNTKIWIPMFDYLLFVIE